MLPNKFFILALSILTFSCTQVKYPYGERTFKRLCGDCHMDDGLGVSSLYPTMKSNKITESYEDLPCIIRNGIDDSTSVIQMLPMPQVSDIDITNIMNYILHDLNQSEKEVFLPEVQAILDQCSPKKK